MTAADLAALKAQITTDEARKVYLYDDATAKRITKGSTVVGHPTWGVGFNCDALPFCAAAIDAQYDFVIGDLIDDVVRALPWTARLPIGPLRAILDLAFNAGVAGLMGFHKMLAFAQLGQYGQAARELVQSHIAPARAQRLAALMAAGQS